MPQGEVIANFKQYTDALAYVDNLIKHNFPAGSVAIVGSDLRTVERIRGKVTYARLAIGGAVTGSWVGLAFGTSQYYLKPFQKAPLDLGEWQ